MYFLPINRMWERVYNARQNSDVDFFQNLLYLGEMAIKTAILGLMAALDDTNGDRYRQFYRLVRADGLGEWMQALDEVLAGPASQHWPLEVQIEQQELTQRCGTGVWQYIAVKELYDTLDCFNLPHDVMPTKVQARRWIEQFIYLRNKTRGHGAIPSALHTRASEHLESSLKLFINNCHIFRRPWTHLQRNLSGKYTVTKISDDTGPFDRFKTDEKITLPDGVYVHFGSPVRVDLLKLDPATLEFYVPNGGTKSRHFEMLSYITGNTVLEDISPFMRPPADLPPSETQGNNTLEVQGPECLGNLPLVRPGYVDRLQLEARLRHYLLDDFRRVITLEGRGGIGKTSLALKVLHEVAQTSRFGIILWFSARDVDLLPDKPIRVKPQVLTISDVATQMLALLPPPQGALDKSQAQDYFASALTKTPHEGMPILFVFDNFETATAPQDLYSWIDQYVRAPNKVLITTRTSQFNGDYSVEVRGMSEEECHRLIQETSQLLGVETPLSDQYRRDLIQESQGHPYVIKVLLGYVKRTGQASKVERIVAGRADILDALFERTFANLTPDAQRVFLTLCSWRSAVAQLALEAVLLRPKRDQRIDVEGAITELRQYSLIEITSFATDQAAFLSVPLIARLFGEKVLKLSPWRSAIEEDADLLQAFGPAQQSDFRHGLGPRVDAFFRELGVRASHGYGDVDDCLRILEFVARQYPPTWLRLASFYEQGHDLASAKNALGNYLRTLTNMEAEASLYEQEAWERLAALCRRTDDTPGEIHAFASCCQLPGVPFSAISRAAFRMNQLAGGWQRTDSENWRPNAVRIAEVMAARISEGDATDCSRLAWLYIHLNDESQGRKYTEMGLMIDRRNGHCVKLAQRLRIQ